MTDTTTVAAHAFAVDLAALAGDVGAINRDTAEANSMTVEETVIALTGLREAIAVLRQCEAGLEVWIAQCFKAEGWRDPVELPGIGMVEVRRSTSRRAWQYDALRSKWVNTFVPRWAELHEGEEPAPGDVMAAVFDCFTVSGAKVRTMKAIGIDVDEFCDTSPGAPTVSIA